MDDCTMLCPYCKQTFAITEYAMANNYRFRCPHCRKYNEGSTEADKNGVLLGVSMLDYELQELLKD